jgi:quinol monooxygenase YgiN
MSDASVVVLATFRPIEGRADDVHEVLAWMVANTRAEPGCERYDLYRAVDGGSFHLIERYTDAAALEAHRAAPYFGEYRRRIADLLEAPVEAVVLTSVDAAG